MDSDEPIDIMSVDVGTVGGRVQEECCCVYMPTDSTSVPVIDSSLKRMFKQKGRVVLLVDFNARAGKSVGVDVC